MACLTVRPLLADEWATYRYSPGTGMPTYWGWHIMSRDGREISPKRYVTVLWDSRRGLDLEDELLDPDPSR